MCPTAEENEQMMEHPDSQLHEKLESLVDKLPAECNVVSHNEKPMEKPRFVHAIMVILNRAENGKIQKASLKRQLDPDLIENPNEKIDTIPGKRRIQEKIEFNEKREIPKLATKMNGINGYEKVVENGNVIDELFAFELKNTSPHSATEIDAIAEAVRILREAAEMLDEKLRQIERDEERFEPDKAKENNVRMLIPAPESPKQQILLSSPTTTTTILEEPRQRPQKLSFSSGFSFPSELRKYRSAKIVES